MRGLLVTISLALLTPLAMADCPAGDSGPVADLGAGVTNAASQSNILQTGAAIGKHLFSSAYTWIAGTPVADFFTRLWGDAELINIHGWRPIKDSVPNPYQTPINPCFWRGSRIESQAGYQDLRSRGFKGIVDLTAEGTLDETYAEAAGLHLKRIPIIDDHAPGSGPWPFTGNQTKGEALMKDYLDFVTNPDNQPVYVHCEQGIGRTGTASAVYEMAVCGKSLDEAMADDAKFGPMVWGQRQFLKQFAKDLAAGKIAGYPKTSACCH